jgi:F420-non-reducing hydrogenase iron-sulfur subunit
VGDCHFLEGNLRAKERVAHAKQLLDEVGLDGNRLEMYHIGASDAPNWAKAVREMTDRARELGPNPIRKRNLEGPPKPRPLTLDEAAQANGQKSN